MCEYEKYQVRKVQVCFPYQFQFLILKVFSSLENQMGCVDHFFPARNISVVLLHNWLSCQFTSWRWETTTQAGEHFAVSSDQATFPH